MYDDFIDFYHIFSPLGQPNQEVTHMNLSKFKNDNRASASLVIEHVVMEAEKQIEKMTGEKVTLIVRRPGRWA